MPSFLSPLAGEPSASWVLRNVATGRVIANRLDAAFDSDSRRRGLLGRDRLEPGTALIIAPCSSIHTFFMRFAIDVLFTSREGRVVKLYRDLPAWRIAFGAGAYAAIELPAGGIGVNVRASGELLEIVRATNNDVSPAGRDSMERQ